MIIKYTLCEIENKNKCFVYLKFSYKSFISRLSRVNCVMILIRYVNSQSFTSRQKKKREKIKNITRKYQLETKRMNLYERDYYSGESLSFSDHGTFLFLV